MRALLIAGTCSYAIGTLGQIFYDLSLAEAIFCIFIGLVLGLLWRRSDTYSPSVLLLSVCISLFALGVFRTEVFSWQFGISALESSLGETVTLEGIVVAEPDYREKITQLHVETGNDKILVSTDRYNHIHYGDKIVVEGKLEKPESFETDLGRTFNYPDYLLAKKIEYRISFAKVEVKANGLGNPIITSLLSVKQKFLSSLEKIIPEPEVGLGKGLLLGVKSALGEDIETSFRKTGIIHIVVLSGYNVMLVVTFILYVLSFFLTVRRRFIFGLMGIVSFALVVGLSATVVRASIMATLVLFAQSFGRTYDVLRSLFFAGFIMLLINPYLLIYDIGFQLSFMATLGLVMLVPYFESNLIEGKFVIKGREFLLATVATQIAVLPLLLYHIGEFSVVSVLVNLLVLPVVAVAMLLTFFTGLIGLVFAPFASLFGFMASLVLGYILFIAKVFAELPFASVIVPQFSLLGVFISYLFIGVMVYLLDKKLRSSTSDFADWKIQDEADEAGSRSEPAKAKDLPIFFR